MKKVFLLLLATLFFISCKDFKSQQKSDSGVTKASVKVKTNENGFTIEQQNIMERLKRDNEVGSIKHLYIVSAYTGDVLQYSTVRGKVTSGNKRLSPKSVNGDQLQTSYYTNSVTLNGKEYITDEVLDDGGAYGDSGNYLYWFDTQGNYNQYYPSGGTYLQISDKPLRIKKTNFSLE